eukprot:g2347.t1
MVLMVGALSDERERGGVVPYSFSLHRESDLSRRPSTVHFPFDAVLARTLQIRADFRANGAGLGSAAWDGSFVLAELMQRLDIPGQGHAALDGCLLREKHDRPTRAGAGTGTGTGAGAGACAGGESVHVPPLRKPRSAARKRARAAHAAARAARGLGRRAGAGAGAGAGVGGAGMATAAAALEARDVPWRGLRAIELGTGLGLTSLVSCLLGADTTATDGDARVLEHARQNVLRNVAAVVHSEKGSSGGGGNGSNHSGSDASTGKENERLASPPINCDDTGGASGTCGPAGCTGPSAGAAPAPLRRGRLRAARLLWGDARAARALQPPFDLVLAADVVYGQDRDGDRTATFRALLSLLLLAYVRRRPSEAAFFDELWRHFEGGPLARNLLHPDFVRSGMTVYLMRRRMT